MIKLVTGFVKIPGHPRSVEEYEKWGDKLLELHGQYDCSIAAVKQPLEMCWLYKFLQFNGQKATWSMGDNPQKNSLAYHIVQHQKTEWLVDAAYLDPEPTTFAWVDYGIFRIPGVTAAVILDFVKKAQHERAIAIPGCWKRGYNQVVGIPDDHPCWRFCGGLFVCPRDRLFDLDWAVKAETRDHFYKFKHVSWEVNTWARMEQKVSLPFFWYPADHNQSMFTNYPETRYAH